MNKKKWLLPKLAIVGIRKNTFTYLPYIATCIFSVFIYFTFDSILNNKIMQTLPKAMYAWTLMSIGFVLLGIILLLFLFYTNNFLMKRRTKELGLYSILGMEKKHIGIMMFLETIFLFCIVVAGGIIAGVIFSKLIFLILLNLIGLSPNISFEFSGKALVDTLLFFGIIFGMNLITNLLYVGRANPTELINAGKKGEKESKHLWFTTLAGVVLMGGGYYIAITAVIDSYIFINFFLAVLFVVLGTYFLFTSGSVALLHVLKKKKNFYYRSSNFITVSGMLYRMKKNAAGLVNICIFATMVMITVLCTVSLYAGLYGVMDYMYPYDININYNNTIASDKEVSAEEIKQMAEDSGVTIHDSIAYAYMAFRLVQRENQFVEVQEITDEKKYLIKLLTVDDYNKIEGTAYSLNRDEVLVYSTGNDYIYDKVNIGNYQYHVKEELMTSAIEPKEQRNTYQKSYYMIVSDLEVLKECSSFYGVDTVESLQYEVDMNVSGEDGKKEVFMKKAYVQCSGQPGFIGFTNNIERRTDIRSMYGGLLFIGIFFGIIFTMCLILVMYYKQITEGFEDKDSFEIMQKVGMSDSEVKATIKKQILLVFFLPLIGAVLHMTAGLNMVVNLFAALNFFNTSLIIGCMALVVGIFIIFYLLSYTATAKAYYKIVKQME